MPEAFPAGLTIGLTTREAPQGGNGTPKKARVIVLGLVWVRYAIIWTSTPCTAWRANNSGVARDRSRNWSRRTAKIDKKANKRWRRRALHNWLFSMAQPVFRQL